jgi:DNA-3-methyladenine glycosylase I
MSRCEWVKNDPLEIAYHDTEWGVPVHDDRTLFEFLILEGVQSGLSWNIVLKKRENYREAFDRFDPEKVARYNKDKVQELLQNEGIIRNKSKIEAAIVNARKFLEIQQEFGSFDAFIWKFVDGKPIQNKWKNSQKVPITSKKSELISKELKRRGFKYVGSTICYAFMQAVGLVNDHTIDCFRHQELQ